MIARQIILASEASIYPVIRTYLECLVVKLIISPIYINTNE